jgi:hypothetical protein
LAHERNRHEKETEGVKGKENRELGKWDNERR